MPRAAVRYWKGAESHSIHAVPQRVFELGARAIDASPLSSRVMHALESDAEERPPPPTRDPPPLAIALPVPSSVEEVQGEREFGPVEMVGS